MVSDRVIIASNGDTSVVLTQSPFYLRNTSGFDKLEVTNVTSQGFDQDGASLLNSYVQPRPMEIEGQIKASSPAEMQMLKDKLFCLFAPKKDITITHFYGGKNRNIKVRVKKSPEFSLTDVSVIIEYSVSFTALEPYWQDINETLIQIADIKGKFHFPLAIHETIFGLKSPSLIANIFNHSCIKVGMRIVFQAQGRVVNPQLFDIKKREFVKILCEMESGERITIETGKDRKTITRNKNGITEDYLGRIDLVGGGNNFLELEPGDNLLRYAADEGENFLETNIYFYNKYMGV